MFRLLAVLAMLSAWVNGAHSSPNDSVKVLPDSSNFVTASLVIAEPLHALYSVFGHATLRMECPSFGLDYVFTFESDPNFGTFMTGIAGKAKAKYVAVPTDTFINDTKKSGRGLKQYKLNLTHHEKQELWRLLDNDYVDPEMRNFNYLQNNCSSVSLIALENVMDVEKIDFHGWPEPFKLNNGALLKQASKHAPWLQYVCTTFWGTEIDIFWVNEQRISPLLFSQVLKNATIVSTDGTSRAMVIGEKQLLPLVNKFQASPVTPTWVFGALLLIVVLITLAQLRWKLRWLPRMLDIVLMTLVTIAGLLLIYTSFVSGLFGKHWNWYLIPFNPLPLIIWLIWRKRKGYYKVYLLYTVVLVLFILATPLSEQLDLPHQLITATLAVRCLYNYYEGRRQAT